MDTNTTLKKALENAICKNHTGKMKGFQSLSTSPLCNGHCVRRAACDAVTPITLTSGETVNASMICSKCYSMAMQARYSALSTKLENNSRLLADNILQDADVPFINQAFFRFEAFGDLINEQHACNLMTIARNNPHCTFALWTKNPQYIRAAIRSGAVKPTNMIIILSSPFMNVNVLNQSFAVIDSFVDKVFTVYDKERAQDVAINCGGRKCAECRRCYMHNKANAMIETIETINAMTGNYVTREIEIVNELLK